MAKRGKLFKVGEAICVCGAKKSLFEDYCPYHEQTAPPPPQGQKEPLRKKEFPRHIFNRYLRR